MVRFEMIGFFKWASIGGKRGSLSPADGLLCCLGQYGFRSSNRQWGPIGGWSISSLMFSSHLELLKMNLLLHLVSKHHNSTKAF